MQFLEALERRVRDPSGGLEKRVLGGPRNVSARRRESHSRTAPARETAPGAALNIVATS
jgi:hypothetical protein